jgi:RNA polymerase primary sigma factor
VITAEVVMKPFPQAMSAKDELRRAHELVALREVVWIRLLDYPPFAEALCDRLAVELGDDAPGAELATLSEAAAQLRERDTKQRAQVYAEARDALAKCVHRHRHEARVSRSLASEVRMVGREGGLDARKPPRGSRVYRCYLAGLRRAEARLTAARQAFVANNLRLVVTVARRYKHPFMTQADLIQEGTLGLLRAVDGYDPSRGTRFSTYAGWWIKHGITRALANHGLTVRVPANVLSLRAQLSKAEQQFIAEHGRSPTDKELARELGSSIKTVANARQAVLGRAELPGEGDNLADEQSVDVDGLLDWPVLERELLERVDTLPGIEAAVIRKRFALDGDAPMTLAEIGEIHCLSRERIRQIEKQALRRMRGELQPLMS